MTDRYGPAARAALEGFGIRPADVRLHQVSENITFRAVDADGGAELVLRLHRPGYRTLAELESERAWTDSLTDAGISVPRRRLAPTGVAYVPVEVDASERRYAGLLDWIPGEPLADVLRRDADESLQNRIAALMGTLLARLHEHSRHWRAPRDIQRPHYDVEGLLGEQPLWGRFWEHPALAASEREALSEARHRLRAQLRTLPRDPTVYGMVHSDLHAENLLIEGDSLGAIDFDDAGFGWYHYDIASALKAFADQPGYAQRCQALLEAYRRVRPLGAQDETLLEAFLLIRDLALVGWYADRPEVQAIETPVFERIKNRALRESERLLRQGATSAC